MTAPALGQQCYVPSTPAFLSDACDTTANGDAYEYYTPEGGYFLGPNILLYNLLNDIMIWDVTTPLRPAKLKQVHIPWDWGSISGDGTHGPLINHLGEPGTYPGFNYVFVPLASYGWDFLKVDTALTANATAFLGHGYKPASNVVPGWNTGPIFKVGTTYYLVSQALDSASLNAKDYSIRIYPIGGTSPLGGTIDTSTLTPATIGSGYAIPAGHAGDAIDNTAFPLSLGLQMQIFTMSGHTYLLATSSRAPLLLVDVSVPNSPDPVATDNTFTGAKVAVDQNGVMWTGINATSAVKGYAINPQRRYPLSPFSVQYASVSFNPAGQPISVSGTPQVSTAGGLLVAWSPTLMGFITLPASGTPSVITQSAIPYTNLDPDRTAYPSSCMNNGFSEYFLDAAAFSKNGEVYVARSRYVDADLIQISDSCLDTTPVPQLSITGTPNTDCGESAAALGYPGDTFTLTNNSTGQWTNAQIAVSPNAGNFTATGSGWTWASPANQTGLFTFTLTVRDQAGAPYTTTTTAYLCGNPKAGISVTPATYLTLDPVTFSAAPTASKGSPTGADWLITPPVSTPGIAQGLTVSNYQLTDIGTYKVYVKVHYAFTGTSDSTCGGAEYATIPINPIQGGYDSCTTVQLSSQPFSVGAVTATQSGSNFPNFVTTSAINLSAPYKLATGYGATFSWNGSVSTVGAPNPASQTGPASGNVTGTIASPTVGTNQNVILTGTATPTGGGNPITIPQQVNFNVSACIPPGAPSGGTPNNTQVSPGSVTLQWNTPTGTGPFTYTVASGPVTLCSQTTSTFCTINTTAGKTYSWQVTANSPCGGAPATSVTFSFTTSGTPPTPTPTPTPTPPPGGSLTITPSPNPVASGSAVVFSFSPSMSQSSDSLTFNFGDGGSQQTINGSSCVVCNAIPHTYTPSSTRTYTVNASGTAGGRSVSGSTSVTVQVICTATSPPTAGYTISGLAPPFQLRVNQSVQFLDTSAGGPTSWIWDFGDGSGPLFPDGSSTLQNPIYKFTKTGTFTVAMTATNCLGSNTVQQVVQVLPACSQTAVPVPSFTWGPTGPLDGFPEQQQPYAGQAVTLTDTSTNSPDAWQWCDFGELGPACSGTPLSTKNVTVTWTTEGGRNVRLLTHNCVGWATQQAINSVTVYPDVRHVVADFGWSPTPPAVGETLVFTAAQGASNGSPDTFVWTFDDTKGTQGGFQASQVTHTFTCGGTHKVTLVASRSNYPSGAKTVTKSFSVDGTPCGPSAVMTVDNAKVNGLNGTQWRTDVRIFNPATTTSNVTLWFLPINANNANPFSAGPYPIPPKGALVRDDVLGWVGSTLGMAFSKTALRVTFQNDQNLAPMIVSKTYTPAQGGGTYGQYAPGIGVIPGSPPATPMWITGLHNNGTQTGYRTNYSLLNLQGDSGVDPITITLYDMTGTPVKVVTQGLLPFGYIQDSIKNLFGAGFDNVGNFSLKIDVPSGASVQAYGSVVDNLTGSPVLIPAGQPAPSMIYLPAVAHLNGKNGTVWRSDMQLTNTDAVAHTWAVGYVPKASDSLQPTIVQLTVGPRQTVYMADALNWIYSNLLTDASQTSGVIKIAPSDGSSVLPAVQARSFNQTANGTFGQNIIPLWGDLGASDGGEYTRLLLTGMASADIARTSIGFLNLSETSSVIYQMFFYDQNGNLLNPLDGSNNPIPYNFSLPPGGWDQDQLENRFRNAFSVALPGNLEAISAEIFVTGGGPGTAYATVTDNITGDPTFIPAQAAP